MRTGYKNPHVQLLFAPLSTRPPFDEAGKREEWRERFNRIKGVKISRDGIAKYPSIRLTIFQGREALAAFLDSIEWALQQVGSSERRVGRFSAWHSGQLTPATRSERRLKKRVESRLGLSSASRRAWRDRDGLLARMTHQGIRSPTA